MARLSFEDICHEPKRARLEWPLVMGFLDEDKIKTIQPYDDALVITLRIGGYDVKRVMVDQGSAAEIMYPDLYKGLSLRSENLTPYSFPLVSFEGKVIIPKGQIRLPVLGDGGGRLYRGECIFSLYNNCYQTLASYFRSSFFHSASEDQVPI